LFFCYDQGIGQGFCGSDLCKLFGSDVQFDQSLHGLFPGLGSLQLMDELSHVPWILGADTVSCGIRQNITSCNHHAGGCYRFLLVDRGKPALFQVVGRKNQGSEVQHRYCKNDQGDQITCGFYFDDDLFSSESGEPSGRVRAFLDCTEEPMPWSVLIQDTEKELPRDEIGEKFSGNPELKAGNEGSLGYKPGFPARNDYAQYP
jgi:hypothetical protein